MTISKRSDWRTRDVICTRVDTVNLQHSAQSHCGMLTILNDST